MSLDPAGTREIRSPMTVTTPTPEDPKILGRRPDRSPRHSGRLGAVDILFFSAWCGLAAGLVEVGTRLLTRIIAPHGRLYMMSRHFVWLAPLSTLLLFLAMGLGLAIVARLWPRIGGWLGPRVVCFCAVLPSLIVISSRVYPLAWAVLALGVAWRLASFVEAHAVGLRRRLIWSFPGLLLLVLLSAGIVFGGDWLGRRKESGRPRPPVDAPNVLLVVLDTVRADRMSLYGYERPTTPNLERLAGRAIRFDEARATAPWTLASHASFFSGRWPHQIGAEWMTPLRWDCPTLAESLSAGGYATAGFVANVLYCSYETGLNRGFTHYEDYVLGRFGALRTAWLTDWTLGFISDWGLFVSRRPEIAPLRSMLESLLEPLYNIGRKKDAGEVNREFLAWLSRRAEPTRPFFAFLNYFDTHTPYVLPPGTPYRFGQAPQDQLDFMILIEEWTRIHDKPRLPPRLQTLARDSYDNCLAYLDERLGELFDELERRGILDRTLVIVLGDHGEGLGEHDLFDHGESLYRTEIRVPLLIVPPVPDRSHRVVTEPVTLRDLPATITDLVGLGGRSLFPGQSLARFWRGTPADTRSDHPDAVMSELPSPNPSDPNNGRSPAYRGPLISLADGDFVYIRNDGDGSEELFNEREDPRELINRARDKALEPVRKRLREQLDRFRAHPGGPAK
jgi:arylsulfatase A-like enzyme